MSMPSKRIRAGGRVREAQHGAADRGLAGAGFADEPDDLAAADGEAHAVDGADDRRLSRPNQALRRRNAWSEPATSSSGVRGTLALRHLRRDAARRSVTGLSSGCSGRAWPGSTCSSGGYAAVAGVDARGAARREGAARRQVERIGHVAGNGRQRREADAVRPAHGLGDAAEQAARVGMARVAEDVADAGPSRRPCPHTSRPCGRPSRRPRPGCG